MFFGSNSRFGWLKLACSDQKTGYRSPGFNTAGFFAAADSAFVAPFDPAVLSFGPSGVGSTSILSASPSPLSAPSSYVVTFSIWYSPRRLTELLSPRGKTWNKKMNTLPQNGVSSARDKRRSSSFQLRRMTCLVLLKCLAVKNTQHNTRKSKTLRQPAMV